MEPKRVAPLVGIFNFAQALVNNNGNISAGETALTTELTTHTVDTCFAYDSGLWETGILPRGEKWIIVEQYPDEEHARVGHAKWVKLLTEAPDFPLKDIDMWSLQ